jgi:hypothetical protein
LADSLWAAKKSVGDWWAMTETRKLTWQGCGAMLSLTLELNLLPFF